MQGMILQPWTTVQSSFATFTQSAEEWLDLCDYADATFWIDVTQISSGSVVQLTLQTSPTPDESYFFAVAPPITLATSTTPRMLKTVRSAATVPLAKHVRWQLTLLSGTSPWSVTFRVRVAPSRQSFFVPTQLSGCVLWLRADLGITLQTGVKQWNNQQGDTTKNLIQNTTGDQPGYTASDGNYNGQASLSFNGSTTYMSASAWSGTVGYPNTYIFIAHNNGGSSGTAQYIMDGATNTDGEPVWYTQSTSQITFASLTLTQAWTSPAAVMGEVTNTSSSHLYFNNFTSPAVTGTGAGALHSMTFGEHSIAFGGGNNWNGYAAEVIAFSRLLTQPEKNQLRNYLNARYALSIS